MATITFYNNSGLNRKTKLPSFVTPVALRLFINNALQEDIGSGDVTTMATIPKGKQGKARLLVKESGIIAGVEMAVQIFKTVDKRLSVEVNMPDGVKVSKGDVVLTVKGSEQSILTAERLVLNCMQRMSGIATKTNYLVQLCNKYKVKLLDTRKTTPLFRMAEKWAVLIGGGINHRFGLYDMVLIKDNHVDYAGGIENAINAAVEFVNKKNKKLKIEIEVRNEDELNLVLKTGKIHRILLDNFSPESLKKAVKLVNKKFETEASGNINEKTILAYAKSGVDYISMGALTHSYKSIDLSLKAFE